MTEIELKNYEKACDEIFGKWNRMDSTTPKCLICRKDIVFFDTFKNGDGSTHNSFEGGDVRISFGYGSRHDQLGGHGMPGQNPMEKLLNCDKIYARICDSCFEEVYPLMEGYMVREEITEERVV